MSGNTTDNTELRDFERMLAEVFTPGDDHRIGEVIEFDRALWGTLSELGLARLTGDESAGGSGAGWTEAALLLTAAGAGAAAVPVAENDLLAGWLLATAGLEASDGVRTAAVLDADGGARFVPWARDVDSIVVLWQDPKDTWRVADVPRARIDLTDAVNLASEPRDRIRVDVSALSGAAVSGSVAEEFRYRGALARALASVGAMDRILELVVGHVTARVQFGRPLGKFQAVQALVSDIAAEGALARAASDAAVAAAVGGGFESSATRFAVAAAASCTGHAAAVVARNAHQALGAIGFTMEHELHRHANRILSWRSEFGTVSSWDAELLDAAVAAGDVWSLVTE
ncbi:acyl-CoA dehydrogenase family protein [Rhodococcus artemisiae]|uniref:Acyl-CoA dehydrogenase family protein n=1 Tax=Rhodococcus artemisiae TaxID=714159 RepID=A0ABU7L5X5_9NOCA|nr:acyl-CoA dehydrogenase family protein [Rhodococcus artemisiae]MEE2056942.1 acyl-CoA dehydrogenase family protein [Rhodococcus artemisiae]